MIAIPRYKYMSLRPPGSVRTKVSDADAELLVHAPSARFESPNDARFRNFQKNPCQPYTLPSRVQNLGILPNFTIKRVLFASSQFL